MRRVLSTALALITLGSLGFPQKDAWRPLLVVEFDLVDPLWVGTFESPKAESDWEKEVARDLQNAVLRQVPFHGETGTALRVVLGSQGDGDLRSTYLQAMTPKPGRLDDDEVLSLPRWPFRDAERSENAVGNRDDFRAEIKGVFELRLGDASALVSALLPTVPVGRRVRLYPHPATKCALPVALAGAKAQEVDVIFQFGTVKITDGGLTSLPVDHFVEVTPGLHTDEAGKYWNAIVAQDVARAITLVGVDYEHYALEEIPADLGEVQGNKTRDVTTDVFLRSVAFKVPRVKPKKDFEQTIN